MRGGRRVDDMTGERYGSLTVLGRAITDRREAYWLCRCICGNEIVERGSQLRKLARSDCGCMTPRRKFRMF